MANTIMLVCIKGNNKLEERRVYYTEEIAGELVKVKGVEGYFNKREHFVELQLKF